MRSARSHELVGELGRNAGRRRAPRDDEALGGEPVERLQHRGPRDAEIARELARRRQANARRELAGEDAIARRAVDLLVQRNIIARIEA